MWNRNEWRTNQSHAYGVVALPHNGYKTEVRPGIEVGTIIVGDRQPWRVLEIREKPEDLWPARFETAWQQVVNKWAEYEAARLAGEPESWGAPRKPRPMPVRAEWTYRPINIVVQHAERPKSKPKHLCAAVNLQWQVLPEHYSVCRLCGELPPCRHMETEATIRAEVAKAETLMEIPRGACLGCGEAITSRMKAVRFPGPNLWRPDWGTDSAVFHARRQMECSNAAFRYRQQWEKQGLNVLQPALPDGTGEGSC